MPSLLEALEKKYFSDCELGNVASSDAHADPDAAEPDKRLISIFIPRMSPLHLVPELLVLNDCDIDCAGDFEAIKEKCRRVRELDLAQNKLNDWQQVVQILEHMPRVEFLNLSKNRLAGPIPNPRTLPINNLKSMVLNGTYLDWPCIEVLLANLPLLEELHLSLNDYKEVLIDAIDTELTAVDVNSAEGDTDTDTDANADAEFNERNDNNYNDNDSNGSGSGSSNNSNSGSSSSSDNDNDNNCCESAVSPQATPNNGTTNTATKTTTTTTTNATINNTDTPTDSCNGQATTQRKHVRPHRTLKTLHFTGNPVESWLEICRLGRVFPSLENLVLADCPIKAIQAADGSSHNSSGSDSDCTSTSDDVEMAATATTTAAADDANNKQNPHKHFVNLRFLNLSYSNINTWDDIDRIAKFPKLHNLRVKHWPLWERLECTEHERRQLLIARLPNVSLLNGGGAISADEREDAERAFIRYYMDKPEWERPKRYDELVAIHGKLDPLVNINLKPDKRLKVLITYKEKTEPRLVDIYCTVGDLKFKLEKLIGLPANKMRLYYMDQDYREFGPEEMRFSQKRLYSYNIQTGDEIIIDEKK